MVDAWQSTSASCTPRPPARSWYLDVTSTIYALLCPAAVEREAAAGSGSQPDLLSMEGALSAAFGAEIARHYDNAEGGDNYMVYDAARTAALLGILDERNRPGGPLGMRTLSSVSSDPLLLRDLMTM